MKASEQINPVHGDALNVPGCEPDPAWFHWVLWPAAIVLTVLACWIWPYWVTP